MTFSDDSRYTELVDRQITQGGRTVAYKGIRRIAPADPLTTHEIVAGERYDLVADEELGHAELFWRLADANYVRNPNELTRSPGTRIVIPQVR
jgi:hypothetical protein